MSEWRIEGIEHAVRVVAGSGEWVPLVLDSPHSGSSYPRDFNASAPVHSLRSAEDLLVDRLFDPGASGALMLAAEFPRIYIDPNRALEDIDVTLIDGEWPYPAAPGEKNALGKGLIWRRCIDGTPVYDRLLVPDEVSARIDRCWRPYRGLLERALDQAHARAGAVWHINCHSMPSLWPPGLPGEGTPVEADFLLGDRDGTTCDAAFTQRVREILEGAGFSVAVNDRFKGVDIVERCGRPADNRHSLQIEIVRDRYMDEQALAPNSGYDAIRDVLMRVLTTLSSELVPSSA